MYHIFLTFKYIQVAISNIFETFHSLPNTSKATNTRIEKYGQHKLDRGGYQKLRAQIVRIKRSLFVANFFLNVANELLIYHKKFSWCYALQGNAFQEATTEEDLRLSFKYGFQHVMEHRKSLGSNPISPLMQTEVNKTICMCSIC